MKMTLNLGAEELKSLHMLVNSAFGRYPLSTLVQQVGDYLILSSVEEFYTRLHAKFRAVVVFGLPPGKKVKMSLKRHEAIGLLHLFEADRADGDGFVDVYADDSYEAVLMATIVAEIQKTYF